MFSENISVQIMVNMQSEEDLFYLLLSAEAFHELTYLQTMIHNIKLEADHDEWHYALG
jgi:hypothetical protein